MDKEKLIALINTCYEAVNESKAGPVVEKGNLMHVGFSTFMLLMNEKLEMERTREPWRGDND